MEINLDTNINNYLYINYMLECEGKDNGKSKSYLEREQTTTTRKWETKKIISRNYPAYTPPKPEPFNFKLFLLIKYIVAYCEKIKREEAKKIGNNCNYNSNPNQKYVRVNKELCDNATNDNYYAKINLIALKGAMSSLTPKAFELWIYFSKNQDKYDFYLSKVDFLSWSNVKSSSYFNAFKELEEQGYLIPTDTEKAECKRYNFYEIPREEQKQPVEITVNKIPEYVEHRTFNF